MTGRPNALNEQQTARVINLYEQMQLSVEKIAERFETNCMTVWRTLKRHGVEIRPNARQSKVNTAEVIRLYRSGMSSNEIAEQYGLRGESIRYRLRKAGVIIRTKSEAVLAYRAAESQWTPERDEILKRLWSQGLTYAELRKATGVTYTDKSFQTRAKHLGLPPRRVQRSGSEISTLASAVVAAKQYRDETLITFLPDSPQLEADWRYILSSVRRERAAAQEAARV